MITKTEEDPFLSEPHLGSAQPKLPGASDRVREVNLLDVLTQLARRKRLIGWTTVAGILVGGILCLIVPPEFTAITKIMPPQQAQSMTTLLMNQLAIGGASSLAAAAGSGLGLKNPNDIYIGILNSRLIEDAIIRKFDLEKVYRAKNMSDARKRLKQNTDITSGKDGLISISVEDTGKERVPQIANAYVDELRTITQSLAFTEASQRRLFYEEQLKQAKDALVDAVAALQQVQRAKGIINPDAQARSLITSLAGIEGKIAEKNVELQALRSYSTEQNPEVKIAESQLESLKEEAARLEQNSRSSGYSELGMKDIPGASLEYIRAEHELLYRQTLFDLLVKQYDSARLDEAKESLTIQVLEPAIEPDRKTSPKRLLLLIISTSVGLVVGCVLVLCASWFESIRSDPNSLERLNRLLGAIKGTNV